MKTVALDTNVIITFATKRQPQFEKIKNLLTKSIDGQTTLYLPVTVFLETEWVLRSNYKQTKDVVINFLEELLSIDNLKTDNKEQIQSTLLLYRQSMGISFSDCLIVNQIKLFKPDQFLTFDKDLEKLYQSLI